jgi:hypothetical protein
MRFPRWLVVTLMTVSVLAPLGSGVSWWVTWPERTARAFLSNFSASRYDELAPMLRFDESNSRALQSIEDLQRRREAFESIPTLEPCARSLKQVILGTKDYWIMDDGDLRFYFVARKGTIHVVTGGWLLPNKSFFIAQ